MANATLSEELLKKVKKIEFHSRKLVNDAMSGNYRSHFRGLGMQFSEHRVYEPGDDIRHVDWKASARGKELLIKKFEEERELNVFLVVDISGSELFGSNHQTKSQIIAEVGGMLAHAANYTGDKIGLMLFSSQIEKTIRPKKGRIHVQKIIRELLLSRSKGKGTQLKQALESTEKLMKHSGIVFIISDFIADGYHDVLKRLSKKHDVVAVSVQDKAEREIPLHGYVALTNPETGEDYFVDADQYSFKEWLKTQYDKREAGLVQLFKESKVEKLSIISDQDYGEAIVRFFQKRKRR